MTCPIDPIAWGEKNRVSLATGKTHEWVLARTMRDRPTIDSVVTSARAVVGKWFQGTPIDVVFADAGDAVDDIQVTVVSYEPPAPGPGDQRREELDPLPMLASAALSPIYVTVRFNYRGYPKSLPWPVWTATSGFLRVDKLCPVEADWMLISSRSLAQLPTAPPEASLLDKLGANAPAPIAGLAQLTQLAGWALGIYIGVQVLGLARTLLPSPRRSAA